MVHGEISKTQKEDRWSWVEIGEPFPEGPVKVQGENNQYVALWYKHGKPVQGRAWSNGGVVECSFPYLKVELTGKKDLGGKIQILAYEWWREEGEVWAECGFVYRWVKWSDRKAEHYQPVRCGDSTVILFKGDDGEVYAGNIDMTTETAKISYDGKSKTLTTGISKLMTIVRDLRDPTPPPPPEPTPEVPEPPPPPPPVLEYFDVWGDLNEGDDFSRAKYPVVALDRPLNLGGGEKKEMIVALWYKHGQPACGNVWNNGGKIAAEFVSHGETHTKKLGSLQVLVYNPRTAGFKLAWKTYKEAMAKGNGWWAVRVNDTAPCVVTRKDGTERLGKVQLSEEKASIAGTDPHKPERYQGPQVQDFLVLCRDSPVPGAHYKEDNK